MAHTNTHNPATRLDTCPTCYTDCSHNGSHPRAGRADAASHGGSLPATRTDSTTHAFACHAVNGPFQHRGEAPRPKQREVLRLGIDVCGDHPHAQWAPSWAPRCMSMHRSCRPASPTQRPETPPQYSTPLHTKPPRLHSSPSWRSSAVAWGARPRKRTKTSAAGLEPPIARTVSAYLHRQSDAIRGHQRASEAISGIQKPSEVISGAQCAYSLPRPSTAFEFSRPPSSKAANPSADRTSAHLYEK